MKLTNIQIKNAQLKDKPYKLSDGRGLCLLINPNGSKYWRMAYRFDEKQKSLAFGVYPDISLLDARKKCEEARQLILQGIDPMQSKKTLVASNKYFSDISFQNIANEWITIKGKVWSEGYTKKLIQSFENNLYPYIGNTPIDKIKPMDLLTVFQIIETRGALVLANKVRQQCTEVFTYGVITGRCENNPCFGLEKAMVKNVPEHFAYLLEKDIPDFLARLREYEEKSPIIGRAARLLILTGVRTGELRGAEWGEIDRVKGIWEIPAERMKKRKPHIIPLSHQAIEILNWMYEYTGHCQLVFTGRNNPNKPISDATILRVIERIGYKGKVTGHGFRHTMSTILHEHNFNSAHIELQLAHVDKNSIRGTYNHAQYLEDRRVMLQWYADHLDELETQKI